MVPKPRNDYVRGACIIALFLAFGRCIADFLATRPGPGLGQKPPSLRGTSAIDNGHFSSGDLSADSRRLHPQAPSSGLKVFSGGMPGGPLPATLAGVGAIFVIAAAATQVYLQRRHHAVGGRVPRDVASSRNWQWHTKLATQPLEGFMSAEEVRVRGGSPESTVAVAQVGDLLADAVQSAQSAMIESLQQGLDDSMKTGVDAVQAVCQWATDLASNVDVDTAVLNSVTGMDKALASLDANVASVRSMPTEITSKIVTPISQVATAFSDAAGHGVGAVEGIVNQTTDPVDALWSAAQQGSRVSAAIVDSAVRHAQSEAVQEDIRRLQEAAPGIPATLQHELVDKRVREAQRSSQMLGSQAISALQSVADKAKEVAGTVLKTTQDIQADLEKTTENAAHQVVLAASSAPLAARTAAQEMALQSAALRTKVDMHIASQTVWAQQEAARAQAQAQNYAQGRVAYVSDMSSRNVQVMTDYVHRSSQHRSPSRGAVAPQLHPSVARFSSGVARQVGQAAEHAKNVAMGTFEAAHAGFEGPVTIHEETRLQAQQRADMKSKRWEEVSKFMEEVGQYRVETQAVQRDPVQRTQSQQMSGSERGRPASVTRRARHASPSPIPMLQQPHPAFAAVYL